MKQSKKSICILIVVALLGACTNKASEEKETVTKDQNPFLKESPIKFQSPNFDAIKDEHYRPAFMEGIRQKENDILAIVESNETPSFDNTILALEQSGKLLSRVSSVFSNLTSAHTNETLKTLNKEITPLLTKLRDDVNLNEVLFQKVKQVKEGDNSSLNKEQLKLLDDYYQGFVRGGANLDAEKKEKLRTINKELSILSVEFGDNVLAENNDFELLIEKEEDLSGLPEGVKSGAKQAAEARGHKGKWLFTLHVPSITPFLQYADNRALREKMYKGYIQKGNNGDGKDNKEILRKIANLRVEKAKLMGYETHADFVLERTMAKTPENVYKLLDKLWTPAIKRAKAEVEAMQKIIEREGGDFKLEGWDWKYYAEKVKKEQYNLDEEEVRPYFKLSNVQEGTFIVAKELFGITFEKRTDIPVYHSDVETFEVKDADGSHIGLFLVDYFPRESKRSGAWMNSYRKQSNVGGKFVTPIITNVCNFTKPIGNDPSLLTLDEVETLFHEFGHALHGLLSNVTYNSLSGTSVPRDFVELPSQIMEHWATAPEMLRRYAKHYKTGEVISEELITKINNASKFNQGFITTEYLAAAFLDLNWHTLTEPFTGDVTEFENKFLAEKGLIPEIVSRYRSPYFQHVFAGGYSSGYYSYIWAEVLDADGYNYFEETDIFDKEKGKALRYEILSKGGTDDPMQLYLNFRGKEPDADALLENRGLK